MSSDAGLPLMRRQVAQVLDLLSGWLAHAARVFRSPPGMASSLPAAHEHSAGAHTHCMPRILPSLFLATCAALTADIMLKTGNPSPPKLPNQSPSWSFNISPVTSA
jgi:hypothetical protein